MPTTYATAFAAHHARGSTLSPPDTMVHRPTMLRARDTMVHRPTILRARDTTTTTRSTQSLGDFSASSRAQNEGSRDPAYSELGRGSRLGETPSCCASTTLSPFPARMKSRARIQPKAERTLAFGHGLGELS